MYLLRTGVPSIDELFHQRDPRQGEKKPWDFGIRLPKRTTATSFCIVGPDGAGKSVLAMHLASRYLADCVAGGDGEMALPHVFYVSSDLSHPVAETVWRNFALHAPNARAIPFQHPQFAQARVPEWLGGNRKTFDRGLRLRLRECPAEDSTRLARVINDETAVPGVAFVDLAARTAGDDWAFVHRLLAVLPPPRTGPRHLLVIDAVEGMETFGGELDAFGQQSPRRARIAKLMRLASGKCHVVLIIEEPAEGVRLPEQFVADIVGTAT
jgi:hypothetical protein